jgi:transposase-like protein
MAGGVVFFKQKVDTTMGRRRQLSEEQIFAALHAESGTTVVEVCREVGLVSRRSMRGNKNMRGGTERVAELRELR